MKTDIFHKYVEIKQHSPDKTMDQKKRQNGNQTVS